MLALSDFLLGASNHLKIYQTFEDISLLPADLLSDLEDEHEEDCIENYDEYWNTPWNIDDSSEYEEEEAIIFKAYQQISNSVSKSIIQVIKHANFQLYRVHLDRVI